MNEKRLTERELHFYILIYNKIQVNELAKFQAILNPIKKK